MMRRDLWIVPCPIQPTIETMQADHVIQRLLCDDLEDIADRLPALPPVAELRQIGERIVRVTGPQLARAEQVLRALPAAQRQTPATLEALHQMHVLDELHGQDLITALCQPVGAASGVQVGQLAYMLRCFFDGCRRAIRLKESYLSFARHGAISVD